MKKIIAVIGIGLACLGMSVNAASAAPLQQPCYNNAATPPVCVGVTAATPLPVATSSTPSGTQDTNLKQVNGATVNVGPGASGTGTQRVTTSSDSSISPLVVTPTDKGGAMTTGGTSQTLAALNASRKGLVIQNSCTAASQNIATAEDLYIAVSGAATVGGTGNFADLPPCGSVTVTWNGLSVTAAVTVNAATTAHRWSATEVQ